MAKKTTKKTTAKSTREPTDKPLLHNPSDFLFFWKEDQPNGWLCQWYRSPFSDPDIPGITFNCAEQYMMYRKAMLFNDLDIASKVLATTSPRKQKGLALASKIQNFDMEIWCREREGIVRRGSLLKFSQATNVASFKMDDEGDPVPLRDLLLATGERHLAEASPFDEIWGIGMKADEALGVPREEWGMNLLGKALMAVREELRRDCGGLEQSKRSVT